MLLFSRVVVVGEVGGDGGREPLACGGEEGGGMFSSCVGLLKASLTIPLLPTTGFFFN